jgi:hypothetical protein
MAKGVWTTCATWSSLLEQATDVRKRWLIANFILGELQGAYWGIASFPSSYGAAVGYPDKLIAEVISQVRIDLDVFSDAEIAVLENHGYFMADVALARHASGLLDAPPAPRPAPSRLARRGQGPLGARREREDEALRARLVSAAAEHFDAVVVGSGFGGSVTAFRLAEGGLRVCLLERGKAYPPGSFPRTPYDMARNFWDPSEGKHGMFDLWTFKGLEALVSSGLGGGSLIYANVLIRKDAEWFVNEEGEDWPVTRADLDPHYDRVEPVLAPQCYPFDVEPVRVHPQDAGDAVRVAATRGRLEAPGARGHVREPRSDAAAGRPDRRRAQPARHAALHVPPLRRVRHRLQLREQEHARLQLPQRVRAARRGDQDALRGAHLRCEQRRLRRALRHARARARGRADRHLGAAGADADVRAARALGGRVRHAVPPAPQRRRAPRPLADGARHALLRQRRQARVPDEERADRPRPPLRPRVRAEHRPR